MGIDYPEKLLTCKQGIAGSLRYQFIDLLMPGWSAHIGNMGSTGHRLQWSSWGLAVLWSDSSHFWGVLERANGPDTSYTSGERPLGEKWGLDMCWWAYWADPLRGYLPTGWGWGRMLGRGSVGKTLGYASGENLEFKIFRTHIQAGCGTLSICSSKGRWDRQTIPRSSMLASLVLTGKEPTTL